MKLCTEVDNMFYNGPHIQFVIIQDFCVCAVFVWICDAVKPLRPGHFCNLFIIDAEINKSKE